MAKKKVSDYIAAYLDEFEEKDSYELSRCEFEKEGPNWYLRVYVDKLENGEYAVIGTDDCEKISRYLSKRLDEDDPIEQNYYLEVSSPGMDRPLISDKDFARFMGEAVEVKLYKALDGKKFYEGKLTGYADGIVTITDEKGKEITLQKTDAAKINLAVIF
ncbi:MAG: ribosome maturation factor RimP [Clostridia bacterium]|nr:ribosome maturation factor RimP [Clostridia bacterium]